MAATSIFNIFFGGFRTTWKGLRLTFRHLLQSIRRRRIQDIQDARYFDQKTGMVTLKYPYETVPVPDNGRYQLHNEIEDCIVCDKCAKICPVDCIEIEPIKSVGEYGKTSDGTSLRIYAAKFDIDMAKCCFCGLCTTVCPTESLTMTPEYDFSTFDVTKMNFGFGNMTFAEAEAKRQEWEIHKAQKDKDKEKAEATATKPEETKPAGSPGGFRPRMPVIKKNPVEAVEESPLVSADLEPKSEETKPASSPGGFRPRMPVMKKTIEENPVAPEASETKTEEQPISLTPSKPVRSRPMMPPSKPTSESNE